MQPEALRRHGVRAREIPVIGEYQYEPAAEIGNDMAGVAHAISADLLQIGRAIIGPAINVVWPSRQTRPFGPEPRIVPILRKSQFLRDPPCPANRVGASVSGDPGAAHDDVTGLRKPTNIRLGQCQGDEGWGEAGRRRRVVRHDITEDVHAPVPPPSRCPIPSTSPEFDARNIPVRHSGFQPELWLMTVKALLRSRTPNHARHRLQRDR